jgi:hypothetical protein
LRLPCVFVALCAQMLICLEPAMGQQVSPSSSPSAAPQANQSSATAPTLPPAPAVSSGPLTIESTALAYQVLGAEAADMARQLGRSTANSNVFVGTQSDIVAILQLRTAITQADTLRGRFNGLYTRLQNYNCAKKKPVPRARAKVAPLPPGISAVLPASFSDLVTAIQTAASIAQVNETLTAGTGSLTDEALIGMVASDITARKVYVPGAFPPMLVAPDLSQTLLGGRIIAIDVARHYVLVRADSALGPQCDSSDASYKAVAADVAATAKSADTFENSLFTGNPTPSKGSSNTTSSGSLQQLLYADLFLDAILPRSVPMSPPPSTPQPPAPPVTDFLFLSLHTLDSGGDTLTKSSLFTGTRNYFSGAVMSTFRLYRADGTLICGGSSVGYRGYVQDNGMSQAIINPSSSPAVADYLSVPSPTRSPSGSPAPTQSGSPAPVACGH